MQQFDTVSIERFLKLAQTHSVFDVRSPGEFANGHIPNAFSLPLFDNDERAEVGTLYKAEGRQAAILQGLDFVGVKMRSLVEQVIAQATDPHILLHCWRGGMRSQSVAWLLSQFDFRITLLEKGYKQFRRFTLAMLDQPRSIRILSGSTGSGKTAVLQELKLRGEQVIDLEGIAKHKGSAFGGLGVDKLPTQEMFENQLAIEWWQLDPNRPVWLEDESKRIGNCTLPLSIWRAMRSAEVLCLNIPLNIRCERLVAEYGSFPKESLITTIPKLRKRMGGLHNQEAIRALEDGDLSMCSQLLLTHYYDKTYRYGLEQRNSEKIRYLPLDTGNPKDIASKVLEVLKAEYQTT